jgi:hypothetical protein
VAYVPAFGARRMAAGPPIPMIPLAQQPERRSERPAGTSPSL